MAFVAVLPAVEPGKPSLSALEVTAYRAIGAKHPDAAIRNGDSLAERFLGPDERALLKKGGSESILAALEMATEPAWESLGIRRVFAFAIHTRTRHIDAVFADALAGGARQVVLLGAGLDSRAYRAPDGVRQTRVFEVDFPPTQEYKKKRVREILGSLPSHVTYVPIDFTKEDLATVLARAGYDRAVKTIFVWEGVTFYLPEEAVDATLRFVASNAAPGSRIVFDYFLASGLKTPTSALKDTMKRLEAVREPLIFGLPDEDPEGFVTRRGLAIDSNRRMRELMLLYLPKAQLAAAKDLAAARAYICTATVPNKTD
ncbi:MAG TPA: SAM-dependent methyltransferase [Vicinamibacterales bacterium]|nr:SAM-dependent methyltransferase [Vicinamibacterales bacterium]